MENHRLFAGGCDVVVVMDHCASVAFMENGVISIVSKGSDAEEQLDDSTGRMCVWHAGVHSCIIGRRTDEDIFATCPNATATVLCDGPVMGRLLLGLLKWQVAPELRRAVLISWEVC